MEAATLFTILSASFTHYWLGSNKRGQFKWFTNNINNSLSRGYPRLYSLVNFILWIHKILWSFRLKFKIWEWSNKWLLRYSTFHILGSSSSVGCLHFKDLYNMESNYDWKSFYLTLWNVFFLYASQYTSKNSQQWHTRSVFTQPRETYVFENSSTYVNFD